jgi:hypothetical protein
MKTKWNIKTNGGEVTHSTTLLGCRIEVRNYPGTRSMDGVIFNRAECEWHRIMCDKMECSVSGLKTECLEWVKGRVA